MLEPTSWNNRHHIPFQATRVCSETCISSTDTAMLLKTTTQNEWMSLLILCLQLPTNMQTNEYIRYWKYCSNLCLRTAKASCAICLLLGVVIQHSCTQQQPFATLKLLKGNVHFKLYLSLNVTAISDHILWLNYAKMQGNTRVSLHISWHCT